MKRGITVATATMILTAAWLLVYGPTVPGGFIKDDFGWIYHSRLDGWDAVYRAFSQADGFYRPIVQQGAAAIDAADVDRPRGCISCCGNIRARSRSAIGARNVRWTELRALTNNTLKAIQAEPLPARTLVVLQDDLTARQLS